MAITMSHSQRGSRFTMNHSLRKVYGWLENDLRKVVAFGQHVIFGIFLVCDENLCMIMNRTAYLEWKMNGFKV